MDYGGGHYCWCETLSIYRFEVALPLHRWKNACYDPYRPFVLAPTDHASNTNSPWLLFRLFFDFLNISLVQAKGATQFRTLDDLFDEAASRLTATDETEKVSALKTKDILDFCSLSCISKSLKNICEVKGPFFL